MRTSIQLLAGFTLLFSATWSGSASAGSPVRSGGNFGLGVGGGTWTNGLSLKYFMSSGSAVQAVVGGYGYGHKCNNGYYDYYCEGYGGIGISGDYLWEMPALTNNEAFELAWNAGLGPSVVLGNGYFGLGVHGTIGLEFNFNPVPIDLVLEYKPGIYIIPGVGADLWTFTGQIRIYPF